MGENYEVPGISGMRMADSAHPDVVAELRSLESVNIIFGAGFCGKTLLAACQALGVRIMGFCDNNAEKTVFCGLPVVLPQKIVASYPAANFLLAVADLHQPLAQLKSLGVDRAFSLGVLQNVPSLLAKPCGVNQAWLEYVTVQTALSRQQGLLKYLGGKGTFLPCLDIMVTEFCSLNCRDCSTLMPHYKKREIFRQGEIIREIDAFTKCVSNINTLYLIGGEPFLHPQIHVLANHAAHNSKIDLVCIITNGTIIPKEEQLTVLSNEKILVQVSDYGANSTKIDSLISKLGQCGVNGYRRSYAWWCRTTPPAKRGLGKKGEQRLFQSCSSALCFPLREGKLYRCEYAANAVRLGYADDVPNEHVDIGGVIRGEIKPREVSNAIGTFAYDLPTMSICDYCPGYNGTSEKVSPGEQFA